ncbi:MAG: hypothetical protein ACJ74G_02125 [Blastocatellia bacterium]
MRFFNAANPVIRRAVVFVALTCALLLASEVEAQKRKKKPRNPPGELAQRVAKAKDEVVAAAQNYKESLEKLLIFQEGDVKTASEIVEKRKTLVEQQIVSKRDLEESERALAAAQAKVAETRRQMTEADQLIAEANAEKQLALMPPPRVGATVSNAVLIRYSGAHWALTDSAKVQSFFVGQFHHALPISAFGQTATHTQLGFDHSNAMDVAVHPDSAEGRALMAYLRSQGIPFIAFRQAVSGSATGAHIHVGYPSHRIR